MMLVMARMGNRMPVPFIDIRSLCVAVVVMFVAATSSVTRVEPPRPVAPDAQVERPGARTERLGCNQGGGEQQATHDASSKPKPARSDLGPFQASVLPAMRKSVNKKVCRCDPAPGKICGSRVRQNAGFSLDFPHSGDLAGKFWNTDLH